VRNPYLKDPYLYHKNKQERRHIFLHNDIFRKFLSTDFDEEFKEAKYADSFLKNRMMNEMFNEVVPVILEEDDRNSMSFSIENRSPFLDKRLFEIAMSIPTKHYIKNGFMKSILRDSMKGIVPSYIIKERKKIGFNAEITELIDTSNPDIEEYILSDSSIFEIVNKDKIQKLLNSAKLSENSYSKFLFNFIVAKRFMELRS